MILTCTHAASSCVSARARAALHAQVKSLSKEEVEKLSFQRPTTLQEASEISGVTPSALVSLLDTLRGARKSRQRNLRGGAEGVEGEGQGAVDSSDGKQRTRTAM